MSITDELRRWTEIQEHEYPPMSAKVADEYREIADRIDRMHQESLEEQGERHRVKMHDAICKAHADGERNAMKQNRSRSQDYMHGKADAIEEVEREYVKLPVDADGVPIHLGDALYSSEIGLNFPCRGFSLTLSSSGEKWWTVECCYDSYSGTSEYVSAKSCSHVQPDSWERIIKDAVRNGFTDPDNETYQARLVERCRRLAGEE